MGEATIYERLGGQVSIDVVVERFYGRVFSDPDLAPFFDAVADIDLEAHQRAFLASALGGPDHYEGRAIGVAHEGLGISDEQFDRIVDHLVDTLVVSAIAPDIVDEVRAVMLAMRVEVVGR